MAYILLPLLSEDKNAPLPPFDKALDYYLGSQLLRHRELADKFDLSGFESEPERTHPDILNASKMLSILGSACLSPPTAS